MVQEMFRVHAGAFRSEALEPMQPAAVQKKTHLSKRLGTGKQHPGRKGMEPLTVGRSGSPDRPKEEFHDGKSHVAPGGAKDGRCNGKNFG